MPRSVTLSVAKREYIDFRRSQGHASNSVRGDAACLNRLTDVVGRDVVVSSLNEDHISRYFLSMHEEGLGQRTVDIRLTQLRTFFNWCKWRKYLRPSTDLLYGRKSRAWKDDEDDPAVEPHVWIPVHEFPRLLDIASDRHPRDRIAVATALYTLLRGIDMVGLTIDQLDLDRGRLTWWNAKSGHWDEIPISTEYDRELRTYLTWLHEQYGEPRPGEKWYLLCQFGDRTHDATGRWTTTARRDLPLRPGQPLTTKGLRDALQAVLAEYGVTDEGEGNHTYRRSGGRALYDALVPMVGGAEAERLVQTMLGHRYVKTTLKYIGVSRRKQALADQLGGQVMYPGAARPDNVTDIREATRK